MIEAPIPKPSRTPISNLERKPILVHRPPYQNPAEPLKPSTLKIEP